MHEGTMRSRCSALANDGRQVRVIPGGTFLNRRKGVDTMMLTLTLAAGLLAAPEPRAEPQTGWVVEIRGFTKHLKEAEPPKGEGWSIEVRGYTYHRKQPEPPKGFIIEFQWKPQPEPVESTYHDDLSAFWNEFKVQTKVEAVEAFYVDDLRGFYKQLMKR
jgi:hypothetical protein